MASLVVVSSPMWNFSIPWHLKRWIDCVVQARLTFEVRDGQYHGLLGGRRAVILAARDGGYGPGTPFAAADFQLPYLRHILGFMGLGPIQEVAAEHLAGDDPAIAPASVAAACARAREIAAAL
jgi:FMN-dependent NADH-azoreductase